MKKNKKRGNPKQTLSSETPVTSDPEEQVKKWFEQVADDPKTFEPVTEQILIELKDEAKKCHDSEAANYNIKNAKVNPNYQWMKTVMAKGTVSDKIAAHTVAIQDNPICTLDKLQNLVNMVKVGKKKECVMVIDTLTELFLGDLLKPDEKLKPFGQRPLSLLNELSSGNAVTRRKLLSAWYFEDQLKEVYTKFVLALNSVAHDTVDNNKEKAISSMYSLLAGNPEQEKNLLAYIVNKFGDPSQKIASKAMYSLGQLLFKHPNMQGVVLNEVEKLLFRSNVSNKAQYYGLCFLTQFYLSHDTREVARRLIEVYFSFFKACVKKGEIDSRMMSALLLGVNRAYPYAKLELEKVADHLDTMYRIVHMSNFNIGLHALTLLYQVSDTHNSVTDRFYSALYKKLLDPKLFITTHQAMLLSLVYKAMLRDSELPRVKVFVKRLLQLALFMQPSFACGVLYLVSRLIGKKSGIQSLFLKQSTFDDEDHKKDELEEEVEDVKPDIDALNGSKKDKKQCFGYNPLSRNPLYAGGELCAYTELVNLKNHFHPTISLYATNIIEGNMIRYSGDPLKDFTLIRFLDRFAFKNPKKFEGLEQGVHPTFGKRKNYYPKGLKAVPINSSNYVNEDSKNIPVDELFMYSYMQKKYKDKQLKEEDADSDLESVQSEEFEEMLDNLTGASKKDEELDFMNAIGNTLKEKKKKKSDEEEADSEDGDVSDEELSPAEDDEFSDENLDEDDLDMNENDKGLLSDLGSDEDEDIVFAEEEKPQKGKKKVKKDDLNSLFASAEEFASLLDEEGASKIAPGSSNEYANKDNSHVKQIAWEDKRNRWIKGFDNALGKNKGNKTKNFGNKRKDNSKFGNKAKRIKK